ncbi:hypothetical protein EDC52_102355 [Biostraticola tofi]|uniref:Uncharacterized protein n=1 Tax=Biostraticola tofi TaxID=466109 RepID=A0A4R3Z283_9GAMM|nr:hypothetical protein EDC52_102355 [Biostraticola tofi]
MQIYEFLCNQNPQQSVSTRAKINRLFYQQNSFIDMKSIA